MNTSTARVTLFHSPNTRSTGALSLLEELGVDYDLNVLNTLTGQLGKGPYLLGERFGAADVLWGTALAWTTMFKLVPELPVTRACIERIGSRPAVLRAKKKDAELAAAQGA